MDARDAISSGAVFHQQHLAKARSRPNLAMDTVRSLSRTHISPSVPASRSRSDQKMSLEGQNASKMVAVRPCLPRQKSEYFVDTPIAKAEEIEPKRSLFSFPTFRARNLPRFHLTRNLPGLPSTKPSRFSARTNLVRLPYKERQSFHPLGQVEGDRSGIPKKRPLQHILRSIGHEVRGWGMIHLASKLQHVRHYVPKYNQPLY